MKKIILLFSIVLLSLIGFAQNEMTYNSQVFDDSIIYVEKKIDLSYLKENNLVSKRLADSIANYIESFMIRDVQTDYRILLREFALNNNWGVQMVSDLSLGNYSPYYDSYKDTIMVNFFDLIFSNNRKEKKELASRIRNELTIDKDNLLEKICTGYTLEGNRRVVGKLIAYNYTEQIGMLLEKEGIFCWVVDYYTFSEATKEEIDNYEKGIYFID